MTRITTLRTAAAWACLGLAASVCTAQPATATRDAALALRVVQLMKVEAMPLQMLQTLVVSGVQQARAGMSTLRLAPAIADPAMSDIRALASKALEDMAPVVTKAAQESQGAAVTLMQARFSDDELKQLEAFLGSELRRKFDEALPQVQQAVAKAASDKARPVVDARMAALSTAISERVDKAAKTEPPKTDSKAPEKKQ